MVTSLFDPNSNFFFPDMSAYFGVGSYTVYDLLNVPVHFTTYAGDLVIFDLLYRSCVVPSMGITLGRLNDRRHG